MAKGTLNITAGGLGSADIADASISTADIADSTIVTLTCGTTNTSTTVTAASTTGMIVGAAVSGAGVPALATVVSIITNTSFVLSAAATATASVSLIFDSGVTSKKLAQNLTLTGDYVGIPAATTTQRDALTAAVGMLIYNTTMGLLQQYNAQGWAAIDSPPTVSSLNYPGDDTALDTVGEYTDATCDYNNDPTIAHDANSNMKVGMSVSGTGIPADATIASVTSTTAFELSASTTGGAVTNGTLTFNTQTLIITGTNFQTGVTVSIDGTAPSTVTRDSSTQLTVTGTPAKTAGTKVDGLVVTNTSGLGASINVDYSALPAWTTASGNVGNLFISGSAITEIDLAATSATSYALTTGSLPPGLAMATGDGDITGTITGSTYTTYNFTVTATDAEAQSSPRLFNIITKAVPTGGTSIITSLAGYRIHVWKTVGTNQGGAFINATDTDVDYLIIGGGGGGSFGGGGAGGYRCSEATQLTVSAGTNAIVVGGGGVSTNPTPPGSSAGGVSSALGITSAGGGYAGGQAGNVGAGGPGGSGGGGGHGPGSGSTTGSAGGAGNTPSTSPSQGNVGGAGQNSPDYGGGGGGGAGTAGLEATGLSSSSGAGNGGHGRNTMWNLSAAATTTIWAACSVGVVEYGGSERYLAGGGGGAYFVGDEGRNLSGGKGGGGDGGVSASTGTDGAANTGGGGGGNNGNKHLGGSGLVMIRYAI